MQPHGDNFILPSRCFQVFVKKPPEYGWNHVEPPCRATTTDAFAVLLCGRNRLLRHKRDRGRERGKLDGLSDKKRTTDRRRPRIEEDGRSPRRAWGQGASEKYESTTLI